jgi:hypothetical protein
LIISKASDFRDPARRISPHFATLRAQKNGANAVDFGFDWGWLPFR